jgi:hypothetical protein
MQQRAVEPLFTHLAVNRCLAERARNQALRTILFLFCHVLSVQECEPQGPSSLRADQLLECVCHTARGLEWSRLSPHWSRDLNAQRAGGKERGCVNPLER